MLLYYLDFHMNNFLIGMNNFLKKHINTHEQMNMSLRYFQVLSICYICAPYVLLAASFLPVKVGFLREWEEFGLFQYRERNLSAGAPSSAALYTTHMRCAGR